MNIYLNQKEINAIHGAWEEVNNNLEGMDQYNHPGLAKKFNEIIKGLDSIIKKTKIHSQEL